MPNIQSTPRRVIAAKKIHIGAGNLTADSTGNVALSAGAKVSNVQLLTSDSSGALKFGTTVAAAGSYDGGNAIMAIKNSTGVFGLAINTTGTTWKYLEVTSTLNSS